MFALLFGQPARSFFANEIITATGSGSGAVQRELQRLAESGLVVVTRIGNQKHFQANAQSPLFEELRSIVVKTVGLAEPLMKALTPLAKSISLAIVFGSVAARSDSSASDIDLLVVADDLTLERLYTALVPVERLLGRKVNPTLYSKEEFQRRRKSGHAFVTKVLKGQRIVLIGEDEHGAARA